MVDSAIQWRLARAAWLKMVAFGNLENYYESRQAMN